jgi:hypothetical protein
MWCVYTSFLWPSWGLGWSRPVSQRNRVKTNTATLVFSLSSFFCRRPFHPRLWHVGCWWKMDEDSCRLLLYAFHGILGFKIPCLIVNLLTYALCRCLSYILIPQIANPWAYIIIYWLSVGWGPSRHVTSTLLSPILPRHGMLHVLFLEATCWRGSCASGSYASNSGERERFFHMCCSYAVSMTRMENQWKTINNHNV